MPYTFTATAIKPGGHFSETATAYVYQRIPGQSAVCVANISDSLIAGDLHDTIISFSEGKIHFSACYDEPLRPHIIYNFDNSDVSLQHFLSSQQSYLCSDSGYFPIRKETIDNKLKITVYKPSPVNQSNGLLYPVLAVITKTNVDEYVFEYEIQIEELLPTPLLMAIFSLPFTFTLSFGMP